jgi:predicted GH43/DUF377 family glycosyl hydrolase
MTNEGYYRDVALLAFPTPDGAGRDSRNTPPIVTTSQPNVDSTHLASTPGAKVFRGDDGAWIQYHFEKPFICRSLTIWPELRNNASNRLLVQASDDGVAFHAVALLSPPRHGWQDGDAPSTHAIPATTARFFRFTHESENAQPGDEDLDSAKWKPVLKIKGIELSSTARLHHFEGKSGSVWRISPATPSANADPAVCVSGSSVLDLSAHLRADGTLDWVPGPGRWTLLRFGHTSTGHRNDTAGGGKGLECDKFSPAAVRLQYDHWFGEAVRQLGPELSRRVLTRFHVDSWECGSQNWSSEFRAEFTRRRGYDPIPWLPTVAGVPLKNAAASENFLLDLRKTISELIADNFFGTLAALARTQGRLFSAESLAPVITSDNLRHFAEVDLPMGEFWFRSPTHDKFNDVLDAVSGARIYGKPVVQAEAFTELRMAWDEHPALLKTLGDRNFASGINRLVFHVTTHNPWPERKPGMTLDQTGVFLQPNQTWWRPGRAWVDYLARCQALLQKGVPVVDVAVFIGENLPSRAVLPGQLIGTLPGILGSAAVERENARLNNTGQPFREMPEGVSHSANITDPALWIDPLRGYAYDSINGDALLRLAQVRDGRIELPGGSSYGVLVIPAVSPSRPVPAVLSAKFGAALKELSDQGARILSEPFMEDSFAPLGLQRDFIANEANGKPAAGIAWTHRREGGSEIYFVSNQQETSREIELSLRVSGKLPELWDPLTGNTRQVGTWRFQGGRTLLPLRLSPAASVFIVLQTPVAAMASRSSPNWDEPAPLLELSGPWTVSFDAAARSPAAPVLFPELTSWSSHTHPEIRHFSGTAVYTSTFTLASLPATPVVLDLGGVANLAEVTLNEIDCGTVWTAPFRVEVRKALRTGENRIKISVTNTWANRLIGDAAQSESLRSTWLKVPFKLAGKPLHPAGLLGPVTLQTLTPPISEEAMRRVYEEVKTPYKYGIVLAPGEDEAVDCPNVFRHRGKWYMIYVAIKGKVGYETFLAESDDLLVWRRSGVVLPFTKTGWDAWQGDGGIALHDPEWGGSAELQPFNGKYWMTYIGGAKQGYEPDPLSIGLAWTDDPSRASPWTRHPKPILAPDDPSARPFESATLYKSNILWDRSLSLGHPFVMYYNGKQQGPWIERIGMAVSDDMMHWSRHGSDPIVDNFKGISGDPQIVRIGDLWVMFYFGAGWKKGAFVTFACSRDLVNWTKWTGTDLITPSEPYDKTFAHKPWMVKWNGVVYHFYCAVGGKVRAIAVATSKDLRTHEPIPKP